MSFIKNSIFEPLETLCNSPQKFPILFSFSILHDSRHQQTVQCVAKVTSFLAAPLSKVYPIQVSLPLECMDDWMHACSLISLASFSLCMTLGVILTCCHCLYFSSTYFMPPVLYVSREHLVRNVHSCFGWQPGKICIYFCKCLGSALYSPS